MDDIIQLVGDRSPGSAGFSVETSQAREVYQVKPEALEQVIQDVVGSTIRKGDGGLNRFLPRCHPQFTFLHASSVEVTGLGASDPRDEGVDAEAVDADDTLDARAITPRYWRYALYQMAVTFTQRPYGVLSNESIGAPEQTSYYSTSNTLVYTNASREYLRYVDLAYEPSPEFAYAQHGQMKFYTGDNTAPGTYTFSGFPRIVIPKAAVTMTWFQVPFELVTHPDSILVKYVGRINQGAFMDFAEGTLLYLGAKVLRRYVPPFPRRLTTQGGTAVFDHAKLVDLQLSFEQTVRVQSNVPSYGAGNTVTSIANRSFVTSGHNLQPFLGGKVSGGNTSVQRGFFYAGTDNDTKQPVFDSCLFSLLFTDPAGEGVDAQ